MTTNTLLANFWNGGDQHVSERRRDQNLWFFRAHVIPVCVSFMGIAAILLTGCMTQEAPKVIAPTTSVVAPPPRPTALSDEAEAALKAAEQSVIEARVRRALWSAAVEKLENARNAAKKFDSTTTLAMAKEVVALCALSLQQTSAPPVRW